MAVMAPGIIIHSCKTLEFIGGFWNMLPFHSDLSGKYDLDPFSHSSTLKIPLLQSTWTQIASDFLMAVSFPLLFRLRFSSFLTECKPRKRRSTLARSLDHERLKNHEEAIRYYTAAMNNYCPTLRSKMTYWTKSWTRRNQTNLAWSRVWIRGSKFKRWDNKLKVSDGNSAIKLKVSATGCRLQPLAPSL